MRKAVWISALVLVIAALLCIFLYPRWARPKRQPPAAPEPPPKRATITFIGDIMLASGAGKLASARGTEDLLSGVSDVLRADDLTIGNLECAVATTGTPADKDYTFRADPVLLPGLRRAGVDAVSLANNHSLDYGGAALLETLEHVQKAGLHSAGAGANLSAAAAPAIIAAGGHKVAFIAASRVLPSGAWYAAADRPGIAPAYDPAHMLAAIRSASARADIVIAYLHWGKERAIRPEGYQRSVARQCIEAGADLVVGTHPHVLQGFEYHRGKLIAYSLGNFVFNNRVKETAMLQTRFADGGMNGAGVIACHITGYRPQLVDDPRVRQQMLRSLEERSFGVRIADDGSLSPAQ
ncbi:MAG: CapA family protein [Armatimonadota bacterium]|nr:MAG: CapA family protein [Armatimonadota bacterium]